MLKVYAQTVVPSDSRQEIAFLDWVICPNEKTRLGLPSWVPTWDLPRFAGARIGLRTFCAATAEKSHVVFPRASTFKDKEIPLIVRGVRILSVKATCAALPSRHELRQSPDYNERIDDRKSSIEVHASTLRKQAEILRTMAWSYPTTTESYLDAYECTMW